jgi:hypothetical protein
MVIIIAILLASSLCFSIEFALKVRWLKPVLSCVIIGIASIVAFRTGLETGSTVERFSNANLVGDTFEFLEDSTRTNTVGEVLSKLKVVGEELPSAIRNRVPTTPRLLKALDGEFSTNNLGGTVQ